MKEHIKNFVNIIYNESKEVLPVMAKSWFATFLLPWKLRWNFTCGKHLKIH